ncbi:LOW QUALITY PROTEIN: hypothetical protein CVT26_016177 [Gymnopilus dilepis]|uniref:C2H2-type domain-containing protein n=1 Tax=Gymnopilus dilepis TaxID=231916 RepID=A0A409XZ85_9AGAR|nr:LOW QUALITY PROTEIN: hypothetical protein CVT26_016177 [Gymnopilus dilepis]
MGAWVITYDACHLRCARLYGAGEPGIRKPELRVHGRVFPALFSSGCDWLTERIVVDEGRACLSRLARHARARDVDYFLAWDLKALHRIAKGSVVRTRQDKTRREASGCAAPASPGGSAETANERSGCAQQPAVLHLIPPTVMIASSQPIALPQHYHHQNHHPHQQHAGLPIPSGSGDYAMHDAQGSYTGSSEGTFNPASYARHFLGSPISWRAGSWGARFPAGSPTAQLLSSIESGKTPSSGDNDSLMNALNIFEREGELCRNYTCCGLHLTDLHALLEHFEEVHIVMLDQGSAQPQPHIQIPFNPIAHENHSGQPRHLAQEAHQHQQMQGQQHQPYATSFDPDDIEMELDLDLDTTAANSTSAIAPPPPPPPSSAHSSLRSSPSSCAPSPPDTPISTPLSAYPSPHPFVPHHLPLQGHHSNLHSPYISAPSSPLASAYDPSTAASTRQSSPTHGHPNGSGQHTHRPNLNLNLNVAHTGVGGFPRATPAPSSTLLTHPEEAFNTYARFASDYSSSMPGAQFNGAAVDEGSVVNSMGWQQQVQQQQQTQQGGGCVPPALLFASTTSVQAKEEPQSRVSSPGGAHGHGKKNGVLSGLGKHSTQRLGAATAPSTPTSTSPTSSSALPSSSHHTASASTASASSPSLPRPQPSLLLSKPFRCPKPNCNKSYKQANGLKYHMTHGSCNFAPPKDLEHVKDLLERKRREREASANGNTNGGLHRSASLGSVPGGSGAGASSSNGHLDPQSQTTPTTPTTPLSPTSILSLTYSDLSQIPEAELREVEREAERRLRPFACGVGDCTRRYKNMNGLRYHYQHSGDHGALGLALLASGQHECLGWGRRGGKGVGGQAGNGSAAATNGTVNLNGTRIAGLGTGGSVSMPVSRAGSVSVTSSVANSRVGTPQPVPPLPSASTSSSPSSSAATPGAGASSSQQQLQQQHLAQLQAMQAQMHQQQQAQLAMHQQQYGQSSSTPTQNPGVKPTPVQAQAFVVPSTSTAGHQRTGSNGSSTGSPQNQNAYAQVPIQHQNTSPPQAQAQVPVQVQSPQQQQAQAQHQAAQQAQQAYAAAYSAYAQQMYVRAHVHAAQQQQAQHHAQAQVQRAPQPPQQERSGSGSPTQAHVSPTAGNGVIFNASGEYVGNGNGNGNSSSQSAQASTSAPTSAQPTAQQQPQQQPLSPQHAQFAHMSLSSPTMASPTHATHSHAGYGHYEQQQAQVQAQAQPQQGYEQQGQSQGYEQQTRGAYEQGQQQGYDQQQQYHQYGMNGMDVSTLYAQGRRM